MGDLNHAIRAGTMTEEAVHAELGSLVTGKKPGRRNAEEITLFDSTGIGVQDVAAAARAYEIARERDLRSSSYDLAIFNGRSAPGDGGRNKCSRREP